VEAEVENLGRKLSAQGEEMRKAEYTEELCFYIHRSILPAWHRALQSAFRGLNDPGGSGEDFEAVTIIVLVVSRSHWNDSTALCTYGV
jgi:hypothetical protein